MNGPHHIGYTSGWIPPNLLLYILLESYRVNLRIFLIRCILSYSFIVALMWQVSNLEWAIARRSFGLLFFIRKFSVSSISHSLTVKGASLFNSGSIWPGRFNYHRAPFDIIIPSKIFLSFILILCIRYFLLKCFIGKSC